MVGRLDIAYAKLEALADYKALLFAVGIGEMAPASLQGYPRWSASLWDLVARMACRCLHQSEEILPIDVPVCRTGAFMQDLTAVVEHWPDGLETRRAIVGTVHIAMTSRRCNYRATFIDDILGTTVSQVFRYTPETLNPWDLLTRAYAWATTESFTLPPRPCLYVPIPITDGSESYVSLESVSEPARTGCYRWMAKQGIEALESAVVEGPCVTEKQFVRFLRTAV